MGDELPILMADNRPMKHPVTRAKVSKMRIRNNLSYFPAARQDLRESKQQEPLCRKARQFPTFSSGWRQP